TVYSRIDPGGPRDTLLWEVAIHEVAHNWWQAMVASNEVEEAWLDEGIDTWATTEVMSSVGLAWDFSQLLPRGTGWLLGPLVRSDVPEVAIRPPGTLPRGPGDAGARGGPGDLRPHHAHLRRALGLPSSVDRRLPPARLRGLGQG